MNVIITEDEARECHYALGWAISEGVASKSTVKLRDKLEKMGYKFEI